MRTNYFFKKSTVCALFGMIALSFQSNAQQATIDGIIYQVVTVEGGDSYAETVRPPQEGETVISYTAETITIPAEVTIEGATYPVKKIGDHSMRQNPNLKTISLPEGLEIIGNSSFAGCPELTEVAVPVTVKSIEDWAFHECFKLEKINIPDGITAITEHTFQSTNLESIELPASVTKLGTCAFQTAKRLTSINIENITEIGSWTLAETAITSVDLFNVKSIGGSAFSACPELETVLLGESEIPQIGDWTFQNCTKLKKITLPNTLDVIGSWSFSGCNSLESIVIPNSVQLIGAWAFEKTAITEIFASWENPMDLITDANIFGADEGMINFTWKVPGNLQSAYGDEFLGYPVEVGLPESGNEFVQVNAKVFYTAGNLTITDLSGYNAFVYSLDGRVVANFNITGDKHNESLNLGSGIYLFNAINNGKIATTKFVIK